MEYTQRIDGFQIRDCVYLGEPPKDVIRYDIIKWEKYDKPREIYDIAKQKLITTDEFCYSVATLEWNEHEGDFEFRSVGMRWLECNPTDRIIIAIRAFADHQRKELL